MPALARLRRIFLDVHLWLGVGLALALIPLGISGSVGVFRDELQSLFFRPHAGVTQGRQAPPSAYLTAVHAALGEDFIAWEISYPARAGAPVSVIGLASPSGRAPVARKAFLNPPTARVLQIEDPDATFFGTMSALHGSFFIPGIGRKIVGCLGWAMTLSCLTGLWLWWPRGANVLRGLRWRRTPSTNANLHHLIGFWILVPLTVVSVTGVYMSFPRSAGALAALVAPEAPAKPAGEIVDAMPAAGMTIGADDALTAAGALAPGLAVASILPPSPGDASAAWRINFRAQGGADPLLVEVSGATGVARVPKPGEQGPGESLHQLAASIHVGNGTGPVWRALIFVAGLAPAVLAVTGTLIWLRRRARRARLKPVASS